jgi:hypothetical protein
MNKFSKWIGILEMPLMLGLVTVLELNAGNVPLAWMFGVVCAIRLMINIASDSEDV